MLSWFGVEIISYLFGKANRGQLTISKNLNPFGGKSPPRRIELRSFYPSAISITLEMREK